MMLRLNILEALLGGRELPVNYEDNTCEGICCNLSEEIWASTSRVLNKYGYNQRWQSFVKTREWASIHHHNKYPFIAHVSRCCR